MVYPRFPGAISTSALPIKAINCVKMGIATLAKTIDPISVSRSIIVAYEVILVPSYSIRAKDFIKRVWSASSSAMYIPIALVPILEWFACIAGGF